MKDSSLILDNDEISFCIYGLGKTGNIKKAIERAKQR